MRRSLSIALFALVSLLACGSAKATCPVIPFIFANGTTFNAAQVNANFDSVNRCVSGITGPTTTVVGDCAVWANTTGTAVGSSPCRVTVASNAELAALSTADYRSIVRLDYAAGVGAPATTYKASASACTIVGGDGGSQVPSADGNCWLASFPSGNADVRVWGAQASAGSLDAGPAIRAACTYSASSGVPISVPTGNFYLNTLDPDGLGAISLGKTIVSGIKTTCNFEGQNYTAHPDQCEFNANFVLGANLNRPLVYVNPTSTNPRIARMCLNGNRPAQSGWAGGPSGKLYTIQIADATVGYPESAFTLDEVIIIHGYNGNLYEGSFRGVLYMNNVWAVYSGQGAADVGVNFSGFDSVVWNLQQGYSTGIGVLYAQGVNHIWVGGGSWLNTETNLYVAGRQVEDLQISNIRIQWSGKHGMTLGGQAPIAGHQAGGHTYTGLVFDGNSMSANNTYSDILVLTDNLFKDTFSGTVFLGNIAGVAPLPKYNVEFQGGGSRVLMDGAISAAPQGIASVTGFTNDYTSLIGDYQASPSWAPVLEGATTPGTATPVATYPRGTWSRYGKRVTLDGTINLSAFVGAVGGAVITGLPLLSETTTISSCSVGRTVGWTPPAGYTNITAYVGPNQQTISLEKSGPAVPPLPTDVGEWAAPIEILLSCSYPTVQ